MPALGRLVVPDDRDRNFLMSSVIPTSTSRTYRYWWANGWWGDQGFQPHCVAFSWAHYLADGPVTQPGRPPHVNTTDLYREAQKIDQWPGENYDGTSVRAGAKILQDMGFVQSYTWAWDLQTVVRALLTTGPVVVGTWWYEGMTEPKAGKKPLLVAEGQRQGGHAYLLNGVNTRQKLVRVKNSWGRGWGDDGTAWMSFRTLEGLIDADGEACLAVERRNG